MIDGWMDGWMDGWVGGWVDEWVEGWKGGWVDGWPWTDGHVGLDLRVSHRHSLMMQFSFSLVYQFLCALVATKVPRKKNSNKLAVLFFSDCKNNFYVTTMKISFGFHF